MIESDLSLRELVLFIFYILNFSSLIIVERWLSVELTRSTEMSDSTSSTLLDNNDIGRRRVPELLLTMLGESSWVLDCKGFLFRLRLAELLRLLQLHLFLLRLSSNVLSEGLGGLQELLNLHVQALEQQVS